MSMVDDLDVRLSAEEQAQFDAMRGDAPGSNASSPDQLVSHEEPATAAADSATAPADKGTEPAPMGEDDDGDTYVVKDAAGKDVIDANTGKPQKRVSFHKYQRLQQRFDEMQQQFGKTTEERARIDERLKIINEALMTPAPTAQAPVDEDPEPDPEQNIFEHNKWLRRQLTKQGEAFNEFQTQLHEQQQEQEIATTYRQDANRFAQSEPHFGAAYHFLLSMRSNQLRAAGWNDETKISQQIVKEERGLVRNALEQNQSPAKRLFEMARAAGFAPAAPAPKPAAPAPAVPGTPLATMPTAPVAASAPKPGAIPSVSEQVALAAQGVAAATSLSTAGGGATEPLTQAKLLTMDDEEFAAVVASLPKSKLRELFGD